LGDIRSLPLWVALMVLTTVEEEQAPEEARYLLTRSQQETSQSSSRAIMEMIITIMVYKFEQLSQREVEKMLGITLKETRVYREIKEEGREEEARSLIFRQLTRRVVELPQQVRERIETLSLEQLENLGEALLDFTSLADLQVWLEALEG
jgi:predicted transposase YdaD